MAKRKQQTFNDLPSAELPAFKRTQRFETAKNWIQIGLMIVFATGVTAFLILTIIAGVTQNVLPDTEGVKALSTLFMDISANAKAVALFALGFFFREYLTAKGIKS